ncbi:MAG: hypothetical protein B7Z62_00840, partial [Deltaproteobacteria bacterium 37-65-8]
MKTAVLVFPGSNCDHDAYHALKHVVGIDAEFVWHKRSSLEGFDAVVIPGGFTYGDYLRTGAMAKLSPVMGAVRRFAEGGGPVIGICNGFQILLEAGLLPGAMIVNDSSTSERVGWRLFRAARVVRSGYWNLPARSTQSLGQLLGRRSELTNASLVVEAS